MGIAKMTATALDDVFRLATSTKFGSATKLGHNTNVHLHTFTDNGRDVMEVTYHGNMILNWVPGRNEYLITNAGWVTTTTSGRLNMFTYANGGGHVNIKAGEMVYTSPAGKITPVTRPGIAIDRFTGEVA